MFQSQVFLQSLHKFSTTSHMHNQPTRCKQPRDHLTTALLEKHRLSPCNEKYHISHKGLRTPLCFCPQGISLTQNSISAIKELAPWSLPLCFYHPIARNNTLLSRTTAHSLMYPTNIWEKASMGQEPGALW